MNGINEVLLGAAVQVLPVVHTSPDGAPFSAEHDTPIGQAGGWDPVTGAATGR